MRQTTLITLLAFCVAPFAWCQTIVYQGVEIHPGDVLNFQGGFFTADQRYLTYGHSALYLGINPEKGQRSFLDFTATEEHWGGSSKQEQRAFVGRILPEKEFLEANGKSHASFDVFRLRDVSTLNQEKMLQAAKEIALPSNRWGIEYICSSAIATVLARATGHTDIIADTPDDLTTGLFIRHPQLTGKSINIQAALHEIQANELDRATREASTDFLSALPSEAVDSRESIQAGWTDYENWLIRMEAIVSRIEADERRDQEQRNFNRELMDRASTFGYLVAAAGLACSSADKLVAEVREGHYHNVGMDRKYLTAFLGLISVRDTISTCQFEILNKINDSDSIVSWQELQTWGSQYRAAHPSTLRRAANALGAFRDSFRHFAADVVPNTTSDGSQSSSGGSTNHSQQAPDVMGTQAARQLRGIASSGWQR